MMKHLKIEQSVDTPSVDFNPVKGFLELEGKSFPSDVTAFFYPLLDWLDEYAKSPASKSTVNLKLEYFNTASSKMLLEIFNRLEKIYKNGSEVEVNWYYPEDDDDMRDTGQEYSELIKIPFKQIGYSVFFK